MHVITLDNGKCVPLERALKYHRDQNRCMKKLALTRAEYISLLKTLNALANPIPKTTMPVPRLDPRAQSSHLPPSAHLPPSSPERAARMFEGSYRDSMIQKTNQYHSEGPGVSNTSLLQRRFDIRHQPHGQQFPLPVQAPTLQHRWQTAFQEQLGNEQLCSRTFDMAQGNSIPNVNVDRQAMGCRGWNR